MRQLPEFLADRYRFYCTWTLLPAGITYRDFGGSQIIPDSTSLIRSSDKRNPSCIVRKHRNLEPAGFWVDRVFLGSVSVRTGRSPNASHGCFQARRSGRGHVRRPGRDWAESILPILWAGRKSKEFPGPYLFAPLLWN